MVDYERLMKRARRTNKGRDRVDRSAGFAPPGECGPLGLLRTAMMAIESGLSTLDQKGRADHFSASVACIAEGQAMLEDLFAAFEALLNERGTQAERPALRIFDPDAEGDEDEGRSA